MTRLLPFITNEINSKANQFKLRWHWLFKSVHFAGSWFVQNVCLHVEALIIPLIFRSTHVSANDGDWHHICFTWENTAGSWQLYKDGIRERNGSGLSVGRVIRGGGAVVLGQEQDSVGGGFASDQSFIGELTGVNVWDHVITSDEISRMSKACTGEEGNVISWFDFRSGIRGNVTIIEPSSCQP